MDLGFAHHAYLLEGSRSGARNYLANFLFERGFSTDKNPDYHLFEDVSFSVDNARAIREMARNKPIGSKKVFVVLPSRFSEESQNALLKVLEEPTSDTHFFILLPTREMLLPTLLSRLEIIRLNRQETEDREYMKEAEKFLDLSKPARLAFIKKLVDKNKLEEDQRVFLAPFLDALLLILKGRGAKVKDIKSVYKERLYADDPAAMPKLILEHLALVL
jgi:DNA polymerase III delta prime subunit